MESNSFWNRTYIFSNISEDIFWSTKLAVGVQKQRGKKSNGYFSHFFEYFFEDSSSDFSMFYLWFFRWFCLMTNLTVCFCNGFLTIFWRFFHNLFDNAIIVTFVKVVQLIELWVGIAQVLFFCEMLLQISFDPIVAKYNMSQVRLSAYQLVSCFIAWKPEDDQTKEYFTPSQHPQDRQRTALCPPLHCMLIWCFGCSFVCPQVCVHKCAEIHLI